MDIYYMYMNREIYIYTLFLNTVILKYITQIIQQIFGNSQIMKTIDLSFSHKFM